MNSVTLSNLFVARGLGIGGLPFSTIQVFKIDFDYTKFNAYKIQLLFYGQFLVLARVNRREEKGSEKPSIKLLFGAGVSVDVNGKHYALEFISRTAGTPGNFRTSKGLSTAHLKIKKNSGPESDISHSIFPIPNTNQKTLNCLPLKCFS